MTYGLTNAGGGGGEPSLEDRTIVANGTYTASSGYDGLGTVNVNVSATGNADTGTNRTGSAIASGDKIWVNQYYYAADSLIKNTRPVTPQSTSSAVATICGLFDSSLTYGYNNSNRQVYDLTTNNLIGTYFVNNVSVTQAGGKMDCHNKNGTVFALAEYSSNFNNAWYMFYGTGTVMEIACTRASSASAACNYTPVVNKSNWFLNLATNTMYEVDLTDGSTVTSFAAPNVTHVNNSAYHMASSPVYIDDANIFFPRYVSSGATTYYDKYAFDSSNNTFTLITSNVFSSNISLTFPLGVTPDSKYILFVTKPATGTNARNAYLVSLADYTSKQIASYTGKFTNDSYFVYYPETGVFYHLLKKNISDSAGTFYCYRYSQSLETMEVVNLDTTSYPCIWAVNKDLTRILWANSYSGNANVNLSTSVEELGNNIIPYSQSNVNTMTATANDSIAVNSSGSIVLGATGNILDALTSDSVKASQVAVGNNIIIATGNSENYAISKNSGAFRLATLPLATDWSGGLAYGTAKFIAVARSGDDFATTADGINWILGTLPVTATWYGMSKANGIITLHGSMGDYSTIDDGVTWVAV